MHPLQSEVFGWFEDNLWALWASAALLLGCAEMLTTDLTLLMLGSGALAGAVTAAFLPQLVWLQVVVAAVVAVAMLGFVRPSLLKRFREAPGYRTSLQKLVGSDGRATAAISHDGGECKVNGELWSARTMDPDVVISAGDIVEVYEIDGATLVVYPVNRAIGS